MSRARISIESFTDENNEEHTPCAIEGNRHDVIVLFYTLTASMVKATGMELEDLLATTEIALNAKDAVDEMNASGIEFDKDAFINRIVASLARKKAKGKDNDS